MASRQPAHWARWALVVGLVFVVMAAGGAFTGHLLLDRWDGAFARSDLLGPDSGGRDGRDPPAGEVTGPLTYLVIGTDRRAAGDDPAPARSDAIIIARTTPDLRGAYLISVPRDLLVQIPGHGQDKINAAYHLGGGGDGGARLLADTLATLTGTGFDGAAVVDFSGFEAVVDALGGVEICLERPIRSIHTGERFGTGCQHLTGAQALDLARQRYDLPNGDLDRGRNHQRLLQELVEQASNAGLMSNPVRLDRTIRAVGDAVTVDTGGVPLPRLALALRELRPDRVVGITVPSASAQLGGVSYVLPAPEADGLYRALRQSRLADWVAANPDWRTG